MQNVSPENIAGLIHGATPVQIVILILLGAAVLAAIIIIVLNLIKIYTAPLQKELDDAKADRKILQEIQTQVTRISESLWTKDDIQEKIQSAIDKHVINDHVIEHHTKTIQTQ